jgi:hypothetical protein
VYAPPGAAPDPVFPTSPGAAHAPVVWQERSGPTVLDSKHEERRRKNKDNFFWDRSEKNKYIRTSTIEGTKKNQFISS